MKNKKKLYEFLFPKSIANFESYLMEHFIKHKPLISEECEVSNFLLIGMQRWGFLHSRMPLIKWLS